MSILMIYFVSVAATLVIGMTAEFLIRKMEEVYVPAYTIRSYWFERTKKLMIGLQALAEIAMGILFFPVYIFNGYQYVTEKIKNRFMEKHAMEEED